MLLTISIPTRYFFGHCCCWRPGWPDEFLRKSPNMLPNPFILQHKFYLEKCSTTFWATLWSPFNKKAQINNHPIGENSPNLITLLATTFNSWMRTAFLLGTIFIFVRKRWREIKKKHFSDTFKKRPSKEFCVFSGKLATESLEDSKCVQAILLLRPNFFKVTFYQHLIIR
jgi:hypothetical protein